MELFSFFLPGVDASHVYVRAWALGCFHSLIGTQTPSTALRHPSFKEGAGKWCSECDQYPNLPSTTALFSYAIASRKLSANEQFFVCAQTEVPLLQATQIISDVCFITDHVAYASSNKTKIVWIEMKLFFFTRCRCASCLRACLGARLLLQSYQYPNLSKGADGVGGQLRGDKECPFSGVTKSGRVWRKVPESGARSVLRGDKMYPFNGVSKSGRVWRNVPESDAGSVDRWVLTELNLEVFSLSKLGLQLCGETVQPLPQRVHLFTQRCVVHCTWVKVPKGKTSHVTHQGQGQGQGQDDDSGGRRCRNGHGGGWSSGSLDGWENVMV